jgi:hypothetical protein
MCFGFAFLLNSKYNWKIWWNNTKKNKGFDWKQMYKNTHVLYDVGGNSE